MTSARTVPRWWFWLALALIVSGAVAWRASKPYPIYDIYPVYFGAQAWMQTGSAYDLDAAVDPLALYSPTDAMGNPTNPYDQMHRYGNAYPFPAVAWLLPLSLLPVRAFSIIWLAGLVAGLLLALRWARAPIWFIAYWAVLVGLRLEQFAIVVLIAQIIAVYVYRERRAERWAAFVLALCCAVMLLKPTQGAVLALALLVASRSWRHWRATLLAFALVWGLPTLLDPNWLLEWLAASRAYRNVSLQYIPWFLLLALIPVAWSRDWVTGAAIAQFAISPYTWFYTAASLPVGLLWDRRLPLLIIASLPTIYLAALLLDPLSKAQAEIAAITLTMLLPAVGLSVARWREKLRRTPAASLAET
jgi:hypothetical protein